MSEPTILLDRVSVRHNNQLLFDNLSLQIKESEHWGILGPGGSGKTAFLKLLARKLPIAKGRYNWQADSKRIAFLTADYHFKNTSGLNDFFYQQRFNATMTDDAPTVRQLLTDAAEKTPEMVHRVWTIEKVTDLLKLDHLLSEEVIKLSNGETKRLRLATLLLTNPQLLILDTPLVGLDQNTREAFDHTFEKLAASGIQLIMTLDPDEIPEVITHAVVLNAFEIEQYVEKKDFQQLVDIAVDNKVEFDHDLLSCLISHNIPRFDQVIGMKKVNISYDNRQILKDINWEVKQGERWALLGPNGAGKSTLLSLVNGDNPQAYANDIVLFDRPRGSGETIWDLKRKIGYVSPELLHYYRTGRTCYEVIRSGLREGPDPQPLQKMDLAKIDHWITLLGITDEGKIRFRNASPTEQRLTLIARALIKEPVLLILDEPCQGLDKDQTRRVVEIVNQICLESRLTMVYVTHYVSELPSVIDHTIKLLSGQLVK